MSNILSEIKSNTCPYCGGPYTLNDGGCRAKCKTAVVVAKLVRAAAMADMTEAEEVEQR